MNGVGLSDIGLSGLVTLGVLLVFFGGLVPRWIHNERIKDKNELIRTLQKSLDKRDEQVDKLTSQMELNIKLLEDLKELSKSGSLGHPV